MLEVSATGRTLVLRNPTECGVSECDLETSARKRSKLTSDVKPQKKKETSNNNRKKNV